jgi:type I restriction enzyme S subunit
MGDYYIDQDRYNSLIANKVQPGDILISLVGTVGRILVLPEDCEPGIINPRLVKLSLDQKVINPRFFQYYFGSTFLKNMYKAKVHGATMDVLNLSMIKELPFPLCSIEEQDFIVNYLDGEIEKINYFQDVVTTSIEKLEVLKKSILKDAFSGKLVSNFNEPIDTILDKINELKNCE